MQSKGSFQALLAGLVVGVSALTLSPATWPSPIHQWRCLVTLPTGPLPSDSLEFFYNIRRHAVDVELSSELTTEIWSQGILENNGEWELDVFLINGHTFTEYSTDSRTALTDGQGVVDDLLEDESLSSQQTEAVEDYYVDEIDIALRREDGTAWETHVVYPDDDLDPANFDEAECVISWLVPNGGVECAVPGGGATICTHGFHRGILTEYEQLPHKYEHGGSGFQINQGVNDAWVSDDAPFQGFFFTVYEDLGIFFLSWFTFDSEQPQNEALRFFSGQSKTLSQGQATAVFGADDQRWVTATGAIDGDTAVLKAELTTGGAFNTSDPLAQQDGDYGDITVQFSSCSEAVLTYDFPGPGLSGEMTLGRVLDDNVSVCEALAGD